MTNAVFASAVADRMPLSPHLSIVIPAFNEARRLPATLASIAAYWAHRRERVEIVIVDDGSADLTARLPLPADSPRLGWHLLANPGNCGKGYSVRHGMLAARGQLLLFTDADLSAPIAEIERLEAAIAGGADVAIGSRSDAALLGTRQSCLRQTAGRAFHLLVRAALALPYHDTQCGFKLFTRAAAQRIFPRQRIEGWGFDPELLFIARSAGLRVAEVPVVWSHAEGAKIHTLRDSARMFADIVAIRIAAARGLYRELAAAA